MTYQTRPNSRDQRLQQFCLSDLLEESEGRSADVFVGVLEVVTDGVTILAIQIQRWMLGDGGGEMILGGGTYQTRIISCFNFPCSSSLGQILNGHNTPRSVSTISHLDPTPDSGKG